MKKLNKILVGAIGTFAMVASGLASAFIIDFSNDKDLDTFIAKKMSAVSAQGMALAFIKDGEISWSKNYGYADVETGKRISDDTVFQIASVSKTITSAAAMKAADKGLLDLDVDINQYLPFEVKNPKFPDRKITTRMLIQHTSSIIDNEKAYRSTYTILSGSPDPEMSLEAFERSYLDFGDMYDPKKNFSKKAPGEEREYSNVGYGLIGLIVEKVSGQAFNVYCAENIFKPLGMESAGWMSTEVDMSKLAGLYDGDTKIRPYSVATYPDGMLKVSLKDYAKFVLATMKNPVANNMVWYKDIMSDFFININEPSLQGHSGGDPGVATLVAFNPKTGNGLIVFTNGSPAKIDPSLFMMLEMLNYRSFYNRLAKEAGLY